MSNTSDFMIAGMFGNFEYEFQDLQVWLRDTYNVDFKRLDADNEGGGTRLSPYEMYTLSVGAGTVDTQEVIIRFRACLAMPQKDVVLIVSDDERDHLDGVYV